MNKRLRVILVLAFICPAVSFSQVLINEVQTSNLNTIVDEYGKSDDWIELYNTTGNAVMLSNYQLSDELQQPDKFVFPTYTMAPYEHLLVFASGYTKTDAAGHWETAVNASDTWKYRANTTAPPDSNWRNLSFNDNAWSSGAGGIGYGDGDDATVISNCVSLYMRRTFNITDTSKISEAIFNMDFDDAFVAYLNGVEIARSYIGTSGIRPAWNDLATAGHEAVMYQGMNPDSFEISHDVLLNAMRNGLNVLAIEVHNVTMNNQDLSAIPFISFKMKDATSMFGPTPSWFTLGNTPDYFHASFKLSKSGESIFLFDAFGVLQDSVSVGSLELDDSYARNPDGSAQWCFTNLPTPDTTNSTGACKSGYATIPVFSLQSGFYPGTQTLTLTTNFPGGVIHYTTNGNTPDGNSPIYSSPVTISSTKSVRARVYALNVLPSAVVTNTYLINFDCKLPVYVLTTDSANLWDYNTGIYVEGPNAEVWQPHWGANYWMGWKKNVSLEYFDRDKNRAFRFNAGLSVTGGWSRADNQKPLEISMGDSYGLGELNYPLFSEKPWVDSFDDFIIHTTGNDRGVAHMRDPVMERLLVPTHVDHISFEPCLLFMNGEQWGVYYTRENDDHHYIKSNYGYDKDEIDLLKESYFFPNSMEVKQGSDTAFMMMYNYAMNTSATDANFLSTMNSMMDIENMVDYFAAETFYPNGDWMGGGNNNLKLWRPRKLDGRFRYLSYDFDFGYGLVDGLNSDVLSEALQASPHNYQSDLFAKLIQNPQYKNYFINRYADLMNTIWLPANVTSVAYAFRDSMRDDMHYEFENGWAAGDTNQWKNSISDMLDFASQRPTYARNFIQNNLNMTGQVLLTLDASPAGAGRIQISTVTPNALPWSGVYFNGNPVTITAIPNPGYTFDHWHSNVVISANDFNQSTTYNFTNSDQITAYFNGTPAPAELTISEVNYNSDSAFDAGDWIELHNLSSQDLDISGWKLRDDQDQHFFTFPVNTVLAGNGYLVVAEDLQKFAALHPAITNVMGGLGFNFGNGGDQVRLYDYLDTLYLSMEYADNSAWPQGADGHGYTLEQVSATGDLNDGANWFDGCLGGSPGAAYTSGSASAVANGSPVLCQGGFVTLQANTGGGITYQWQQDQNQIAGATNSSYDASQSGAYSVIVTTNGCASVSDTISVEVLPSPAVPQVSNEISCGAGAVTLQAISADTVNWYDAPNGNLLGSGNSFTTPVVSATSVFYAQASNGCTSAFVNDTVFILPHAFDPVVQDQSLCGEGSVLLLATSNDTVRWYDAIGGNLVFTGTSFQTPLLNGTTTYYVVAGDICPSNYVTATATIHALPVVNLGNDVLAVSSAMLDAGTGFSNYLWSTGETSQTITVINTGTYWVTVTDQYGCTGSDTVNVQMTVGIQDATDRNAVSVYPNPAHGTFTISLQHVNVLRLEIFDAMGSLVWNELNPGETTVVEAEGLAKGIYLLKVEGENFITGYRLVLE